MTTPKEVRFEVQVKYSNASEWRQFMWPDIKTKREAIRKAKGFKVGYSYLPFRAVKITTEVL